MNQTKNLIQYKNFTDEQKAGFDFDNYDYEYQMAGADGNSFYVQDKLTEIIPHKALVYRLKIEPDKFYAVSDSALSPDEDEIEILQGCKMMESYLNALLYIRPAKPDEIPKPKALTLEDRVKFQYADFDVVMLDFAPNFLKMLSGKGEELCHVMAQSMKGFASYVFDDADGFERDERPIGPDYIHPVAVLFLRDESMAIDGDGEERRGGKIEMK